jgi:hypothetical protein
MLFGAVGGIMLFHAGRSIIHSPSNGFALNDYKYYFDRNHYPGGQPRCGISLEKLQADQIPFDTSIENSFAEYNETEPEVIGVSEVESPSVTTDSIEENDGMIYNAVFENGQAARELVWGCPAYDDACCWMECCPRDTEARDMLIWAFIALAFLILVTAYCYVKRRDWRPSYIRGDQTNVQRTTTML